MWLVVSAAAVACSAWLAAVSMDELAKSHVKSMRDDGSITNVINLLVTNGTFCQVREHKWESGCGISGCLVIHRGPIRHCPVCRKVQSQEIGPWR